MEAKQNEKALPARTEMHPTRKFFHAVNGVIMASAWYFGDFKVVSNVFLFLVCFTFSFECIRMYFPILNTLLMKIFGPVMRVHEVKKFSGIFFFVTGVFIAAKSFHIIIATLSILYLGFGDPFASAVGITLRKYCPAIALRASNGKSFTASLINSVFCMVITHVVLQYHYEVLYIYTWSKYQYWGLVVIGGLSGGMSEFAMFGYFLLLDDNLLIPILSSFSLYLFSFFFGILILVQ